MWSRFHTNEITSLMKAVYCITLWDRFYEVAIKHYKVEQIMIFNCFKYDKCKQEKSQIWTWQKRSISGKPILMSNLGHIEKQWGYFRRLSFTDCYSCSYTSNLRVSKTIQWKIYKNLNIIMTPNKNALFPLYRFGLPTVY